MSTSLADIFDAVMARLTNNWDADARPIHWPLTEFHPDPTKLWIQPRLRFAGAEQVTMGEAGQNRINGTLEVEIRAPIGGGQRAIFVAGDLIRTLFARGVTIVAGGAGAGRVHFGVPSPQAGDEDEDWGGDLVVCPFWFDES